MRLFSKGAALEEEGQLRDAVAFYRRAVQLVPDVEQRVHELSLKTGNNFITSIPLLWLFCILLCNYAK
jgi:hypothetical protein